MMDTSGDEPHDFQKPESLATNILANHISPSKLCDLFDLLPSELESQGSSSGRFFDGVLILSVYP